MVLMSFGLNYQTAPLTLREKLVFSEQDNKEFLSELQNKGLVSELLLLSTCNRTELYFTLDCIPDYRDEIVEEILYRFADYKKLSLPEIQSFIYHYQEIEVIRHLLRVASGLDSMVFGEVEILGQIKSAYRYALETGALGRHLDRMFQFTFSIAKQVRSQTGVGLHPVSVASIAVRLADRIFSNLQEATVFLIGAGNLIKLVLQHLKELNVKKIIIANRSFQQTQEFHQQTLEFIDLETIPQHLAQADVLISATTSELPIIGKGMVESALKIRKKRPIYMVDLAVPRDIEPEVGLLQDVYLYNLDDLQGMLEENLGLRKSAGLLAEEIIQQEAHNFMIWMESTPAFETVVALRQKYEHASQQILKKSLQQLAMGKAPKEVLQQALQSLTNRLLHEPTVRLREAGWQKDNADNKDMLSLTRQLFDLKA